MARSTTMVFALLGLALPAFGQSVQRFKPDASSGTATAVVVGKASLVHTTQLLPIDAGGNLVGIGDPRHQTTQLLQNLDVCLSRFDVPRSHLIKLNVYVTGADVASEVRRLFAETFRPDEMPTATFVETALTHPALSVALDAVFAVRETDAAAVALRRQLRDLAAEEKFAHLAVLPPGEVVYISGQAEPGENLADATRKTMESLHRTLDYLGLGAEHVVQLKAFLLPMGEAAAVRREMARFYDAALVPPISLVEWDSSLPIEIEMIAMVPAGATRLKADEPVAYVTPPGMTASPVFSRVACARGDRTVYVSGLYASRTGDGEAQVRDLFGQLGPILKVGGSDLRHLVKATYYVADADASSKLNVVRPDFYDPARPPAASKAMVRGVARRERTITLDMIAVTPHTE